MSEYLRDLFSPRELAVLSSIAQIGDATFHDLMEAQGHLFRHPFFADTKGRIRTKLVQIQCEIESRDPKFPFEFAQREFQYGQIVPEIRNKNVIIHIARSASPDDLPYASKYKIEFSNYNHVIQRQMILDMDKQPPYGNAPFYAILTFGGRDETFSVLQFPEPGFTGIAEQIQLSNLSLSSIGENTDIFERKKAVLKQEIFAQFTESKEYIS